MFNNATIVFLTLFALTCLAGPIEDMQPGEWLELPCVNKIRNILPSPLPAGNGPKSIISAWNSGAYDTKRDRLIITGGGHNDYGGNEIYCFDINTFTWSRVWGPSPNIPATQASFSETYSDGNPRSRHTYDGLEYMPNIDRFWVHGGSIYCGGGNAGKATWLFNFDTGTWTRKAAYSASTLEMVSAYDPATGNMLVAGPNSNNALMEFNPATDTWTTKINYSIGYGQNAALDPAMRAFVSVGNDRMYVFNLNAGTRENWSASTSGPGNVISARYPGLEYDPVSKRLVAWVGGRDVYSLNIQTKTWTRHTGTGDDPGAAIRTGTFNRWRYVPSKNVFIVVNSIDGNVFAYKHNDQSSVDMNSGMKRMDNAMRIAVSPNPFKGRIAISCPALAGSAISKKTVPIKIYGVNGKMVKKLTADSRQLTAGITWNAGDLPGGVYLVSVKAGNKTLSKKIVLTQ